MIFSTVGELRKLLEQYDSNLPVHIYTHWRELNDDGDYERHYSQPKYTIRCYNQPMPLFMYAEEGCIIIENENTEDIEVD